MKYTIKKNTQFNSFEVFFNAKPQQSIIDGLKALSMRWNRAKSCWYGFATQEAIEQAIEGKKAGIKKESKAKAEEITEKFGLKVGQIVNTCWGYDATFYDFYEVVGFTNTMVKLRELKKKRFYTGQEGFCDLGSVVPCTGANRFESDEILKRKPIIYSESTSIRISSFEYAHLWNGKPKAEDDYH